MAPVVNASGVRRVELSCNLRLRVVRPTLAVRFVRLPGHVSYSGMSASCDHSTHVDILPDFLVSCNWFRGTFVGVE